MIAQKTKGLKIAETFLAKEANTGEKKKEKKRRRRRRRKRGHYMSSYS